MNFNHDAGLIDTILTIDTTSAPPLGGQTNVLVITGSGAIQLPSGASGAQPASPAAGMLRYNTAGYLEFYSSSWNTISTGGTVSTVSVVTANGFAGTVANAGSTPAITLTTSVTGVLTGNGTAISAANSATSFPGYSAFLAGGAAGSLPYQTGSNATSMLAAGTSSQVLVSGATPAWTNTPTLTGTNFTGIPNGGLTNSSVTIGSTSVSLGAAVTAFAGLTGLTFVSGTITGLASPVNPSDVAIKSYVDSAIAGLEWKDEAQAATISNLTATYSNGSSGVGATLTNSGAQAALSVDGYAVSLNDRILVKNQSTGFQNGIYTVTTVGTGATNWVLTRAIDSNSATLINNATLYITNGTQAATGWTQTAASPTIGTTGITFVQFSGSGTYTAGTGIQLTGNSFSNTGVLSVAGTANQITSSASTGAITLSLPSTLTAPGSLTVTTSLTVSGLTANSFAYSGTAGLLTTTAAPTNGQLLIGSTGAAPVAAALTQGTGITIGNAAGAITITNAGVTAVAGTANQITASASTGSITLSLPSAITVPGSLTTTTSLVAGNSLTVTTGGATISAGGLTVTAGLTYLSASATVSAAGSTQGTATALTANTNNVTTVGASQGVVLPVPTVAGTRITIINRGANPLAVYPNSGGAIDGGTTNAAFTLPVNGTWSGVNTTTTTWYSVDPYVAASTGVSVTPSPGILTIANTGATSITGTANQITSSASTGAITLSLPSALTAPGSLTVTTNLTVSGLTANTFIYSGTAGLITGTAAPTNGQILIGSTGAAPVSATLTAGANITITNAAGAITIAGPRLYAESVSSPTTPTASGTNSVAIGSGAAASATGSTAIGAGSSAYLPGGLVHSSTGSFATAGDSQHGAYVLRGITTNATLTELFLDGSTTRLVLPNNSLWTFTIMVAARRTDTTGGGAGYQLLGVIRKDASSASATLVGAVTKSILGETNASWDVTVTADTTNGALKIQVTGEAAKTIRWVAVVDSAEVTN